MAKIKDMRLETKVWGIVAIAIAGMLLIGALALHQKDVQMMEDRKVKTRHIVEVAHSALVQFEKEVSQGRLTREEAQQAAIRMVKGMRYEGTEYLWINDMRPFCVMHPYKPELDGTDLSDFKDPEGKRLFVEFVNTVKKDGAGFVPYLWPKPGFDKPVPKISYVKGFEPWGWVIGSGIYLDDVEQTFWRSTVQLLSLMLLFVAALATFSYLIVRGIRHSLQQFQEVLVRLDRERDLSVRIGSSRRDELGQLAELVNRLLDSFRSVLERVGESVAGLSSSARDMTASADASRGQVQRQQQETEQVATAMNEMAATAQEVARHANNAAGQAHQVDEDARGGLHTVEQAVGAIEALAAEVSHAANTVGRLAVDSKAIGTVVDVINGIADQTNLLALNAAIEAARAGESGRGFAVVADEVRTLAQRTQESTREIRETVERLQRAAADTVGAMTTGGESAAASVARAREAAESLRAITRSVATILDMNVQIATAAEEQEQVAEEINRNVHNISRVADESAEGAEKVANSGQQVAAMAADLKSILDQFNLRPST